MQFVKCLDKFVMAQITSDPLQVFRTLMTTQPNDACFMILEDLLLRQVVKSTFIESENLVIIDFRLCSSSRQPSI